MPTSQRVKGSPARAGFTLMELLIVMAIIAFLAAVLVVGAGRFIASAKEKRSDALLSNLTQALTDYHSEFGAFPPMSSGSVSANDIEWWRYLTCTGTGFQRPQRADGTIRQEPFIEEKDLNLSPPTASPRLPRDGWMNPVLYVYPVDNEIANLTTNDATLPTMMRQMTVADTYYHCMVLSGGKTKALPSVQAGRNTNNTTEPSPAYSKKVVSGKQ